MNLTRLSLKPWTMSNTVTSQPDSQANHAAKRSEIPYADQQ